MPDPHRPSETPGPAGAPISSRSQFLRWAAGFSGCDGGDPGSPAHPATWFCGIEWGGTRNLHQLLRDSQRDTTSPPSGYTDACANLHSPFNQQALKLLCAIEGQPVGQYKAFNAERRPFVQNAHSGFFKLNLFPIAFRNTSPAHWTREHAALTGWASKNDYLNWCRRQRLPFLRQQAARHCPKLIICTGKTWGGDFKTAFHAARPDGENAFEHAAIAHKLTLAHAWNAEGALVVITPFMLNRHGLRSHQTIQAFGQRIRELLDQGAPAAA